VRVLLNVQSRTRSRAHGQYVRCKSINQRFKRRSGATDLSSSLAAAAAAAELDATSCHRPSESSVGRRVAGAGSPLPTDMLPESWDVDVTLVMPSSPS